LAWSVIESHAFFSLLQCVKTNVKKADRERERESVITNRQMDEMMYKQWIIPSIQCLFNSN